MASIAAGFWDAIGNTPLIELQTLSHQTGCRILGKAEFLNPGGSIKDRAARAIIDDAEQSGALTQGGIIVEGTAGNTGIGLTLAARTRGYRTIIVMPETQSDEKKDILRLCGADLRLTQAVPYKNPANYVRVAERIATEMQEAGEAVIWANQFDNVANRRAHYETTAQEIRHATNDSVDAFICSVGTGGTLAGVGMRLKEVNSHVVIALADPMGSALYHYYQHGTLKSEGNSITEGIGQGRITANLEGAPIDDQMQITDTEAMTMLYHLIDKEGLFLGGSSGINVAAACKLAKRLGKGKTIVTVLCDDGNRYRSKLYNREFLLQKQLPLPPWMDDSS